MAVEFVDGAPVLRVEGGKVGSVSQFHEVFAATIGIPEGRFLGGQAWISDMIDLDDPDHNVCAVSVAPGQVLTLKIDNSHLLAKRARKVLIELSSLAAFVNAARLARGQGPILALAYSETSPI